MQHGAWTYEEDKLLAKYQVLFSSRPFALAVSLLRPAASTTVVEIPLELY